MAYILVKDLGTIRDSTRSRPWVLGFQVLLSGFFSWRQDFSTGTLRPTARFGEILFLRAIEDVADE